MLSWPILGHFWCSVVTLVINYFDKWRKKNKRKKYIYKKIHIYICILKKNPTSPKNSVNGKKKKKSDIIVMFLLPIIKICYALKFAI